MTARERWSHEDLWGHAMAEAAGEPAVTACPIRRVIPSMGISKVRVAAIVEPDELRLVCRH